MWRADGRERLLKYLAGELSPHESTELDERLLSDDDFLDRLEETWNDLLDAYAAGELGPGQKERLEKILRQSPTQTSRLQTARALLQQRRIAQPQAGTAAHASGRRWFWRTALAVICVAIAVTASFYLRRHSQHKNLLTATRGKAVSPSAGEKAKAAQPSAPDSARHPAFALLLGTGVERGVGSIRTVTLPDGLQEIKVQILLPPQESSRRFAVQVMSPRNSAVKTISGLVRREIFSQRLVQFVLPARELSSGLYTFRVYSEGRSRKTLVASYQAVLSRSANSSTR